MEIPPSPLSTKPSLVPGVDAPAKPRRDHALLCGNEQFREQMT
jgi:hypothetical protein